MEGQRSDDLGAIPSFLSSRRSVGQDTKCSAPVAKKRKQLPLLNLKLEELEGFHFADFKLPNLDIESVTDGCGAAFVLRKGNRLRKLWTFTVSVLLIYTATVFMYRVSFVTFRIQPEKADGDTVYNGMRVESADGWSVFEAMVTVFFWVDLFLNFFFTYENEAGHEVESLRRIARHYMQFYFWVNLLACLPEEAVAAIVGLVYADDAPAAVSQGLRVVRLQRVYRLARLLRVARLGRLLKVRKSSFVKTMDRQRSFRMLNLTVGLLLVVHLLACGWYICAAMHDDPQLTWVARRSIDGSGEEPLLSAPPFDQWVHAMYFVLTVFTTVGFGDMSAITIGEIFYVSLVMAIGAVVHSIIVGEVIGIVTSMDKTNQYVDNQVELLDAFSEHTELDAPARQGIRNWVRSSARFWASHRFDRQEMKDILTSKCMPRSLMGRLPPALFEGKLLGNHFLQPHRDVRNIPPRLPILVALMTHKSIFRAGDFVYQTQDFPFNLFLVMSGTFAYVACPSESGGLPYSDAVREFEMEVRRTVQRKRLEMKGGIKTWIAPLRPGEDGEEDDAGDTVLAPYQTFSCGAYFGDVELLKGTQRKTTARCEVQGAVLVLRKDDFWQLTTEFPQFHTKWMSAASRRERLRLGRQALLTSAQDYKTHAARVIQRVARCRQAWRRDARCDPPAPHRMRSSLLRPAASGGGEHIGAEMMEVRQEMRAINRRLDAMMSTLLQLTGGGGYTTINM